MKNSSHSKPLLDIFLSCAHPVSYCILLAKWIACNHEMKDAQMFFIIYFFLPCLEIYCSTCLKFALVGTIIYLSHPHHHHHIHQIATSFRKIYYKNKYSKMLDNVTNKWQCNRFERFLSTRRKMKEMCFLPLDKEICQQWNEKFPLLRFYFVSRQFSLFSITLSCLFHHSDSEPASEGRKIFKAGTINKFMYMEVNGFYVLSY